MNQIIVINKEKGMTSRDVVNIASKKLGIKKIGHTGTLDPNAEGVLVLLTGKYTKLNNRLMATEKEYIATVRMGLKTTTLDMDGEVIKQDGKVATKKELEQLFQEFPKKYLQEVPLYSSVKVKGKKLYQYARLNQEVSLPKKEVQIKKIELLDVQNETFTFKTTVSKGTYIRSLIRDFGEELNLLFTMQDLQRTRQGIFTLEDAIRLKDLDASYSSPLLENVLNIPIEIVDQEQERRILNGQKLSNEKGYSEVLFLSQSKTPLAIYQDKNGCLCVDVMLGE